MSGMIHNLKIYLTLNHVKNYYILYDFMGGGGTKKIFEAMIS